ncbi:putative acyltransferase [Paraphysoderma sedebokerense]|nr:putative acyltransferase [Paraphysoderma sedebokerense]
MEIAEGQAFYQGKEWRNYDTYIGAKVFHDKYSDDIRASLAQSERLKESIKKMAQDLKDQSPNQKKSLKQIEKSLWKKMESYTATLMADMTSMRSLRFVAFVVNNLLVRLYHQGIFVKANEFLMLKEAATEAQRRGVSLIFLPCHKSHVDYLVISYVFYRLGLALPHIAAGDNLNIPGVGYFLKKSGAFFIRRSFGDDPLYNVLVKEYLEVLLSKGHNIEAFIEGTRSRTGKLLTPKFGILKTILESILSGRVKDAIIVPMSIAYDRVIETESYVNELLGTPKEPESLGSLMNSTSVLNIKWGRIDVRFAKPWSLQEFIADESQRRRPFDPVADQVAKSLLLQALGYRVLADINDISVIMPTALVGTIILTLRGRGVSRDEIIKKVNWLRKQILSKGGRVAEFGNIPTSVIVDRSLKLMGNDLIGERKDLLETVYYVKKRFELSFYRNQVIHLFVPEAIICASMYASIKKGGDAHLRLERSRLLADITFLSQLLKREFIYPPGGAEANMDKTLQGLKDSNVINYSNGMAELSDSEKQMDREKFDFYCFLIWPFIETYWLATMSLFLLAIPPPLDSTEAWVDEKLFVEQVQLLAKTLYYQGDLNYFESINKEILRNSWISLEEQGVMQKQGHFVSLSAAWKPSPCFIESKTPSQAPSSVTTQESASTTIQTYHQSLPLGKLWTLVETIHRFRRDKDGASIFGLGMNQRVAKCARISARLLQGSGIGTETMRQRLNDEKNKSLKKGKSKL